MRHAASLREAISRRPSARRYALVAVLVVAGLAIAITAAISGGGEGRKGHRRQAAASGSLATSGSPGAALGPEASRGGRQRAAGPVGRLVKLSVDGSDPRPAVPPDFLGLSFETVAIPWLVRYADTGNITRLLRSLGHGTLRFGGVSADTVAWSQAGSSSPHWARGTVSKSDLAGLATIARDTGWRVLLTVDLGHYEPAAAAQEAAAARALLGSKLAGIEIGNEPDRFALKGLRGAGWSFSAYRREFEAYRTAIVRAAPRVPIVGPDASSGERVLPWVRASASLRPALLTDHYYPLSSCGSTPQVSELLSPAVRRDESSMLTSLSTIERSSATPLELDETNNISCKGQPGVSNTFASALWAADYVGRAVAAGIRHLDFHNLISWHGSYSPLVEATNGLRPNPEWYALMLAERLRGARPLSANVSGAPDLSASAFLSGGGAIQLLLVNFDSPGATPLLVRPEIRGRFSGGTILRLTGPSPSATSGVKLGGREVSGSGAWGPRLPLPAVYENRGSLALAMPPSSAAVVTLRPR